MNKLSVVILLCSTFSICCQGNDESAKSKSLKIKQKGQLRYKNKRKEWTPDDNHWVKGDPLPPEKSKKNSFVPHIIDQKAVDDAISKLEEEIDFKEDSLEKKMKRKNKNKGKKNKNNKKTDKDENHWVKVDPLPPEKSKKDSLVPHIILKNEREWSKNDTHWELNENYVDKGASKTNARENDKVDQKAVDDAISKLEEEIDFKEDALEKNKKENNNETDTEASEAETSHAPEEISDVETEAETSDLDDSDDTSEEDENETSQAEENETSQAEEFETEENGTPETDENKRKNKKKKQKTETKTSDTEEIETPETVENKTTETDKNGDGRKKKKQSKSAIIFDEDTHVPHVETEAPVQEEVENVVDINWGRRKSTVVEVEPDVETEIRDKISGKKIKIPTFISTPVSHDRHSFTFHMSHGPYDGIERWALIAIKLPRDKFGQPRFALNKPKDYNTNQLAKYEDGSEYNEPYIVASFKASHVPYLFTVGDGEVYGAYTNGRLDSGEYYALYLAGVVYLSNGRAVYVVTGWMEDAHSPSIPTYFVTQEEASVASVVIFPIVLVLVVVAIAVVWFLKRKYKWTIQFPRFFKKNRFYDTDYKFGRLSQDHVGTTYSAHEAKPSTSRGNYKYGKKGKNKDYSKVMGTSRSTLPATLPPISRPSKPKNNKARNVLKNVSSKISNFLSATLLRPSNHVLDYGDSDDGSLDAEVGNRSNYGDDRPRHFRNEEEIEETVIKMTESRSQRSQW